MLSLTQLNRNQETDSCPVSMDMFGQTQSVDSTDSDRSSCTSSRSVLSQEHIRKTLWNKIFLEKPKIPSSGELRYLTQLWVSQNEEPQEELYRAENLVPHHRIIEQKIRIVLKLLSFREQHVLVQFWLARVAGKHQLLTTSDQPFGVGVATEELCSYRRDSEQIVFLVDKDHAEEDISPPARVFRRGLPEWTSDLNNYKPKDFPQQDTAIRCNLHGYLSLPVFDSTTSLCIGVIELLMSSKITDFAFEVQQVHKALKTQSLTSPQVSDFTTPNAPNEQRLIELDIVHGILKSVCDSHNLPLAQTWAVSPSTSIVAHEKALQASCSNFNTKCINKDCMSTTSLPFYVRDLRLWPFREACKRQHLDKSRSFVGRALLARGTSYCQDVTELCEEEYPLIHNARMSGLTSCFAVFLHSIAGDDDYVIEFFLPLDSKDGRHVWNLMRTLKHKVEVASRFELGQISPIEFIGPNIKISSTTTANSLAFGADSLDTESLLENVGETDNERDDVIIDAEKSKTIIGAGSHCVKRGRKRKTCSGSIQRAKVEATLDRSFIKLRSLTPFEFLVLKEEVVRRFNLEGKRLRIKYKDEDNDWILITCDVDLALAFETSDRKSISIHCEAD
ncbi:NIN-like protein [Artemisia annua]|uniref:NIN-like protein n=1 Tax=Artemisia annua TaxID=35608 RepID=A0A2U1PIP8_ARTAN|nr:NIN-like protein [Artemisia annua]